MYIFEAALETVCSVVTGDGRVRHRPGSITYLPMLNRYTRSLDALLMVIKASHIL